MGEQSVLGWGMLCCSHNTIFLGGVKLYVKNHTNDEKNLLRRRNLQRASSEERKSGLHLRERATKIDDWNPS